MLEKIGLEKDWIYEVLMETGGMHRAPMGIWTEDFASFMVDVYKNSSTFNNLKTLGAGSIYFTEDPRYFVETKDAEYFAKAEFKVSETLPGNPARFVCRVEKLDALRPGEPINRAQGLFLEYMIDKSRGGMSDDARKRARYYKSKIAKVAPGSVYEKLIGKLGRGREG